MIAPNRQWLLLAWTISAGLSTLPAHGQHPAAAKAEVTELRRAIAAWMDCIECQHAELESVLRFDRAAVPTLVAILRSGPSPAMLAVKRAQFGEDYDKLASYLAAEGKPMAPPRDTYVEAELLRFSDRQRLRAARALIEINAAEGIAAVGRAIESPGDERFTRRLSRMLEQPRKPPR